MFVLRLRLVVFCVREGIILQVCCNTLSGCTQKLKTAPDLTEGNSLALLVARLINFLNVTHAREAGPGNGASAKANCTTERGRCWLLKWATF